MDDLTIRGAEQLGDLARRLRAAGESGKGLKKELYKGLNRATKPLKAEAQQVAARTLPQSGGLADLVARSKFRTSTRMGRDPSVSIMARGVGATTDKGFVRHKVFGRPPWVTQQVQGGWFTETMRKGAPIVRKELSEAIENVAKQITRG